MSRPKKASKGSDARAGAVGGKGPEDAVPAARPGPAPAAPVYDSEGRRADGRWLSYSDYVNVEAIVSAQRLPEDVPKGRTRAEWPRWPDVQAGGERRRWRPGDRWPAEWPARTRRS